MSVKHLTGIGCPEPENGPGGSPSGGSPSGGNPPTTNPISTGGSGTGTSGGSGSPSLPASGVVPTTAVLDNVDCNTVSGWAFANSGGHAYLDIYITRLSGEGGTFKAATIKANNVSRSDVRAAYSNDPNIPIDCGFVWAIPDSYKNGGKLSIKVTPANTPAPIGSGERTTPESCSSSTTGGTPGTSPPELSNVTTTRLNLLTDNMSFVKPCDVSAWKSLADYKAPKVVMDRIDYLGNTYRPIFTFWDWQIQSLQNAQGLVLNCDYFPVRVARLPDGFSSPEQFLEYIRKGINNFLDQQVKQFFPHPEISSEGLRWENSPLGTVLLIKIPGDNGSVICSDYSSSHWIFSTITDPHFNEERIPVAEHPVSGNRQFGFVSNSDGSYTFYTKGVDRVTGFLDQTLFKASTAVWRDGLQFTKADALWRSFQQGIYNFVNRNGGDAVVQAPIVKRPKWQDVKAVWEGRMPASLLNCD